MPSDDQKMIAESMIDRLLAGELDAAELGHLEAMATADAHVAEQLAQAKAYRQLLGCAFEQMAAGHAAPSADQPRDSALPDADHADLDLSVVDRHFAGDLSQPESNRLARDLDASPLLREEMAATEDLMSAIADGLQEVASVGNVLLVDAELVERYLAADLSIQEQATLLAMSEDSGPIAAEVQQARRFEALMTTSFNEAAAGLPAATQRKKSAQSRTKRLSAFAEQIERLLAGDLSPQEEARLNAAAGQSPELSARLRKARSYQNLMGAAFSEMATSPGLPKPLPQPKSAASSRRVASARVPQPVSAQASASRRLASAASARRVAIQRGAAASSGSSWLVRSLIAAGLVAGLTIGIVVWDDSTPSNGNNMAGVDPQKNDADPDYVDPWKIVSESGAQKGITPLPEHMAHLKGQVLGATDLILPPTAAEESSGDHGSDTTEGSTKPENTSSQIPREAASGANSGNDTPAPTSTDNNDTSGKQTPAVDRPHKGANPEGSDTVRETGTTTNDKPTEAKSVVPEASSYAFPAELRQARATALQVSHQSLKGQLDGGIFRPWHSELERFRGEMDVRGHLELPQGDGDIPAAVAVNAGAWRAYLASASDEQLAVLLGDEEVLTGMVRLFDASVLAKQLSVIDAGEFLNLVRVVKHERARVLPNAPKRLPVAWIRSVNTAVKFLLDHRQANGVWGETDPTRYGTPDQQGSVANAVGAEVKVDMLSTYHAVLGLEAAEEILNRDLFRNDEVQRMAKFLVESQSKQGAEVSLTRVRKTGADGTLANTVFVRHARGWTFTGHLTNTQRNQPLTRTGATTASALSTLLILKSQLSEANLRAMKRRNIDVELAIEDGLAWLLHAHSMRGNPAAFDDGSKPYYLDTLHFYYLNTVAQTLERTGDEDVGGRAWFVELNRVLLDVADAGSWASQRAAREVLVDNWFTQRAEELVRQSNAVLALTARNVE